MTRLFACVLLLVTGLILGCATQHVISTTDGTMINTANTPELNEETGMYEYKDEQGRKSEIKKEKVVQIQER